MPRIDQCRSCAAPIFDVDGVEGACACDDGIYFTLLARQRHENRRGSTRTASVAGQELMALATDRQLAEMASIDPGMFLSPSARREFEAAQQERNIPRPPPGRGRPFASTDDATDGFLDLALEDAPPSDGFDIEFSSGDDIEIPDARPSGSGVGGGRFRIDRPPAREPFVATRIPGPQGGPMREVGRVGRFALLREQAPPNEVAAAEIRERREQISENASSFRARRDAQDAARLNAAQQEKRAALHTKLPTAYDRVASGDFLADADDFD